jgi:hypothetical protein
MRSVVIGCQERRMFHEKQFQLKHGSSYICSMARKKWTARQEITDSLLLFREKRKWQIALRRYVIEQKPTAFYPPYFGLDIINFRKWMELQFDEDTNWGNFSIAWQFDHIVPVAYFDFTSEAELRLCWNFINIRLEKISLNRNRGHRVDVLASKAYFKKMHRETGYPICLGMIDKIDRIEVAEIRSTKAMKEFVLANLKFLETASSFSDYEFSRLNQGLSVDMIIKERELLKKMSG